jgi:hypothetical protein
MTIRNKLAIALMTFLVSMAFSGTASAQAGAACVGTTCGLGGQIRGQVGDGLPIPISFAPYAQGWSSMMQNTPAPFSANRGITMKTAPVIPSNSLAFVGQGLGQQGQIKPSTNATIMQTLRTDGPRRITLKKNVFHYDQPQASIGVLGFNQAVFAVRTELKFDSPHPGTTASGGLVTEDGEPIVLPETIHLSEGGRSGAATLTYCAGASGPNTVTPTFTPGTNWGGACKTPMDGLGINGIMRYTATSNQFGGIWQGRILGSAQVFFNGFGEIPGVPPTSQATDQTPILCSGLDCKYQLSEGPPGTRGAGGGAFGVSVMNPAFVTPTGVYSATIGFNGTILNQGQAIRVPQTEFGDGIPFTGQAATSVGGPLTTGMLTISVTSVVGATPEIFKRTGTDARDANGNGVIGLVAGNMSARSISDGNGNPGWTTLEIPEPSAIFAASAGLFALFGCHQLVRRRSRR